MGSDERGESGEPKELARLSGNRFFAFLMQAARFFARRLFWVAVLARFEPYLLLQAAMALLRLARVRPALPVAPGEGAVVAGWPPPEGAFCTGPAGGAGRALDAVTVKGADLGL